jgi:hypothetical protein
MTDNPPMPYLWDGEAFRPAAPLFVRQAQDRFTPGEKYSLVEYLERSATSHRHYFIALNEAWQNLPETVAGEYPTVEHLRKRALIMTGYRDERSIMCADAAEATRFAAFIKPTDDFSVVSVHGPAVVVWTAKSQTYKAMGKRDFNASKDAVLGYAWGLCGVDPETGNKQAGRAA